MKSNFNYKYNNILEQLQKQQYCILLFLNTFNKC